MTSKELIESLLEKQSEVNRLTNYLVRFRSVLIQKWIQEVGIEMTKLYHEVQTDEKGNFVWEAWRFGDEVLTSFGNSCYRASIPFPEKHIVVTEPLKLHIQFYQGNEYIYTWKEITKEEYMSHHPRITEDDFQKFMDIAKGVSE